MADVEEEISVAGAEMSVPSDPAAAAEATRLGEIREKVEYKVSRLNIDRITAGHVDAARKKLSDILNLAEEYGIGITALLKKFPSMESSFSLQYKADLQKLEETVDDIEDKVYEKIHQFAVPAPNVAQPVGDPQPAHDVLHGGQVQAHAQQAQAASAAQAKAATIAKAVVKYNT